MQEMPNGVPGDASLGGRDCPSGEVAAFFGREYMIPASHRAGLATPVSAYFTGDEGFHVRFGSNYAAFDLWTDDHGFEAIIGALQSVLVRARIAREAAGLPAIPPKTIAWLDEAPF